MTVGLIVAIPEEIEELLSACGTPLGEDHRSGYDVFHYRLGQNDVYFTGSGAGEIASAASTQHLIDCFGAELIINFGVCGGLTPDMALCHVGVVEKIVHYDFDASPFMDTLPGQYAQFPDIYIPVSPEPMALAMRTEPTLRPVICASADKFVEDPVIKAQLHAQYDADICEMEAAGIALTAIRCGVPFLLLKAVSDSASGGGEEFAKMVHEAAAVCVRVLRTILNVL